MATGPSAARRTVQDYPTSDGKPFAETDWHREVMMDLIQSLKNRYRDNQEVYVSGNLLLYYEEGNRRRHVSPDVFIVKGVPKRQRDNYLLWLEGKGPDFVIEVTSRTTRKEDQKVKYDLYREKLGVKEYFLFDPREEYLEPSMQGYRLQDKKYVPIKPVEGRLPSEVTNLHLERDAYKLRLHDPRTGRRLPTVREDRDQALAECARHNRNWRHCERK